MSTAICHFHSLWMPPAEREPATPRLVPPDPTPPPASLPETPEATARARALVGAVARAAVEALTAYRPLQQLSRWLEPAAVNGLALALRHGDWAGAVITRVRAGCPARDIIEGVAQIAAHGRHTAVAIRLEHRHGHWVCTSLTVLLPGTHLTNRF